MIDHDSRKESFRRPFGAAEVSAEIYLAAARPGAGGMTPLTAEQFGDPASFAGWDVGGAYASFGAVRDEVSETWYVKTGGGYYDRWLNSASLAGKMPYTIGVCYDFQVYSALPVESHDHAVDMVLCVVTEEDDEE